MKFNWEEFMDEDNKISVHCKTEEEAIDFCKKMNEHGMSWCNGDSYIESNKWNKEKEKTCYTNHGQFSPKDWYEERGYEILEWSDYMKKEPINYLKYGYVVELEGRKFAIFMPTQNGDCFDYGNNKHCLMINDKNSYYYNKELELKQYDDIQCYDDSKYTIKRIYGYSNCPYRTTEVSSKDRPLIWERPEEVKKMTVSEICKELGYKVEIIAEEE